MDRHARKTYTNKEKGRNKAKWLQLKGLDTANTNENTEHVKFLCISARI